MFSSNFKVFHLPEFKEATYDQRAKQKSQFSKGKRHGFMQCRLKTDPCRQGGKVSFPGAETAQKFPEKIAKWRSNRFFPNLEHRFMHGAWKGKLMPLLSTKDSGRQCNRDQRLAQWWKIKQASRDPREWTPARSEKRTLAFSPLWKEPRQGLLDMEISQEDLGEKTHLPEWLLAPNTCGGPGCLDSWLGGFLMLMEKPTHLVLCVQFALLLAVLLLDTLLPSEFLFIVNLPWPLLLIVRLRVLGPQLVPLLSSSVNKKLDYCEEAIPVYHCCGLFTKKLRLVNGMLNAEGILFLRWGGLSPWNKGSQGSDSECNETTRLRKTQKEDFWCILWSS